MVTRKTSQMSFGDYTAPGGYHTQEEYANHLRALQIPEENLSGHLRSAGFDGTYQPTDGAQNFASGGPVRPTPQLHDILHAYYTNAIGA